MRIIADSAGRGHVVDGVRTRREGLQRRKVEGDGAFIHRLRIGAAGPQIDRNPERREMGLL